MKIFPSASPSNLSNNQGWQGTVEVFADLPDPITYNNSLFLVKTADVENYRGFYRSLGTTWEFYTTIHILESTRAFIDTAIVDMTALRDATEVLRQATDVLRQAASDYNDSTIISVTDLNTAQLAAVNQANSDLLAAVSTANTQLRIDTDAVIAASDAQTLVDVGNLNDAALVVIQNENAQLLTDVDTLNDDALVVINSANAQLLLDVGNINDQLLVDVGSVNDQLLVDATAVKDLAIAAKDASDVSKQAASDSADEAAVSAATVASEVTLVATSAELLSATSDANTVGKVIARRVWDSDLTQPLWAGASSATAPWYGATGVVIHTPV